jgi:radical SAM protein with 4Fe4S-binding SPASM domain
VQLTLGDRSITELDQPELAAQRYYVPGSTEPARTRQCMLPWELPYVDKDGRVFSCCYAASVGSPELGRMEKSTFDEIWNGSPYSQFRRELVGGNSMPGVCRGCTAVPLGPHPLSLYSGRLESVAVDGPGRLRVAVRNTGSVPWELGSVLIGTCRPRDRRSPAADPSWIRENRPCTFDEPRVPPGEVATFSFPVAMMPDGKTAHFAVVVEHVCWLPTTEFSLP